MVSRFKIPPRLLLLGSFGGASVLNYAFGLVMGWLLLPGDFGWLAFAQTLLLVGGLVLQSSFPWSLAKSMVGATKTRRGMLIRGALAANLALAVTAGVAIAVLFALGPLQPGLETVTVTALVVLSLPFISIAATARGAAQGAEHFGVVAAVGCVEIFCKVLVGTALVLAGFGVAGAVAGFLFGAIVASTLGVYCLYRELGVRIGGGTEAPAMRSAAPMFGALLAVSLLLNLDLGALKLLWNDRMTAGYYQAGVVLANAPYYLVASVIVPVLFVQLARFENISSTREATGEALSMTLALVVPLELILVIAPQTVLGAFFPSSYAPGAATLRLLALGNIMLIMVAVVSTAFQAIGRAKVPAVLLLAVVVVEPLVLRVVVPVHGAVGAASVFVAASLVALLSLGAKYLYELGPEGVRPVVSWFLRYVLAAGTAVATGWFALDVLGSGLNLAVCLGIACYLAAVFPLRLVRRSVVPLGGVRAPEKTTVSGRG